MNQASTLARCTATALVPPLAACLPYWALPRLADAWQHFALGAAGYLACQVALALVLSLALFWLCLRALWPLHYDRIGIGAGLVVTLALFVALPLLDGTGAGALVALTVETLPLKLLACMYLCALVIALVRKPVV